MSKHHKKAKPLEKKPINKNIIWAGILLIFIASLLLIKYTSKPASVSKVSNPIASAGTQDGNSMRDDTAGESLEARLDRLILAKEPVFAFFHSYNCQLCIDMIGVVEKVYPEYQSQIALVDVNVYDENNKGLLNRANIRSIPTQIFISSSGEIFQTIGVMSPDQLRAALDKLIGK